MHRISIDDFLLDQVAFIYTLLCTVGCEDEMIYTLHAEREQGPLYICTLVSSHKFLWPAISVSPSSFVYIYLPRPYPDGPRNDMHYYIVISTLSDPSLSLIYLLSIASWLDTPTLINVLKLTAK
jgi:hypothetical protein